MSVKWLVEPEVFQEDEKPLMKALLLSGVPYVECKFGTPYETYLQKFADGETGVFHGSLQFGKLIKQKSRGIAVYCDLPKFECTYYYPRFGEFLLNNQYVMLPIGELERRFNWLYNNLGWSGEVFIRPTLFLYTTLFRSRKSVV